MAEIPAEAVQAASAAIERVMQEAAHPLSYEEMGKAAAVAAAPFLAAQALNDAAEIAHLTGTDGANGARSPMARATWRMVAKWLRARADLARTEPTKETDR